MDGVLKKLFLNFLFLSVLLNLVLSQKFRQLGYVPTRPSYHPRPGGVLQQIIPPGEPWPANPEDYASFSQTTKVKPSSTSSTTAPTAEEDYWQSLQQQQEQLSQKLPTLDALTNVDQNEGDHDFRRELFGRFFY